MTDPTFPDPTPADPTAPAAPVVATKPKPGPGRIILTVLIALVAAAGAWIGTSWVLNNLGTQSPAISETEGVTYTNEEIGFAVRFPGEPTETSTVENLGGLEVPVTQVQWSSGQNLALVGASVFPPEVMEQELETMLTNSLAGAASAAGGTVENETAAELDGVPAKTATLALASGEDAQMLVAFKDNIQVSLFASGDVSLDDLIATFSFTE